MEKFNNIFAKKVSRKRFFVISAVTATAVYSFFKIPFKFLSGKSTKAVTKKSSVNVTLNPDAISRNSGGRNA